MKVRKEGRRETREGRAAGPHLILIGYAFLRLKSPFGAEIHEDASLARRRRRLTVLVRGAVPSERCEVVRDGALGEGAVEGVELGWEEEEDGREQRPGGRSREAHGGGGGELCTGHPLGLGSE